VIVSSWDQIFPLLPWQHALEHTAIHSGEPCVRTPLLLSQLNTGRSDAQRRRQFDRPTDSRESKEAMFGNGIFQARKALLMNAAATAFSVAPRWATVRKELCK
jgi:hypothetical protein